MTLPTTLTRPQLIAVTDNVNQSKVDQDPSTWRPLLASYRCTYAKMWIAVKAYRVLTLQSSEKTALQSMLNTAPPETPEPADPSRVSRFEPAPVLSGTGAMGLDVASRIEPLTAVPGTAVASSPVTGVRRRGRTAVPQSASD
jgi:hypothetical protein